MKINVQTLNQPGSRGTFPIMDGQLVEVLGHKPSPSTLAALRAGNTVEVSTKDVPREKGTDCVRYRLTPVK